MFYCFTPPHSYSHIFIHNNKNHLDTQVLLSEYTMEHVITQWQSVTLKMALSLVKKCVHGSVLCIKSTLTCHVKPFT